MGCDIHLYVEKKNGIGQWEPVRGVNPRIADYRAYAASAREKGDIQRAEGLEKDALDIETGVKEKEDRDRWGLEYGRESYYAPQIYKDWLYDGRNYDLFAILADVRNGRGFAGVKTGDGFNPIADPKGLPYDVSDLVKTESDAWNGDGHSRSWHTLRDLLEYDWNQETGHGGWVGEHGYNEWKKDGKPSGWSGGIGGGGVTKISNEEMEKIVNGETIKDKDKSYYTHVEWTEPYYESAGYFYTKSLSQLEELADGDPDSVRIVFWFDN